MLLLFPWVFLKPLLKACALFYLYFTLCCCSDPTSSSKPKLTIRLTLFDICASMLAAVDEFSPRLLRCCRKLQSEYDRLKKAHDRKGLSPLPSPPEMLPVSPQSARDAELIAEAKLLRQHKGRLEARMQILEDHNKQLESQLHRLRQLLEQVHAGRNCAGYTNSKHLLYISFFSRHDGSDPHPDRPRGRLGWSRGPGTAND